MLAVESCKWLSTVSLVIFPRLVKYPTNLSVISFQDASLASLKLSVTFFKDHCLSYFFMHVSVSNLHFPQMKLASEKPPEAVLEGAKFSWWSMPQTPLDYGVLCTPSLIPYGNLARHDFSCFLRPWYRP